MKTQRLIISVITLTALALACNLPSITAGPTATLPPELPPTQPSPSEPSPCPTPIPALLTEPATGGGSQEAILILEPGPGSRLTSPLRVAGLADTTFEQHLLVRLAVDDGTEIASCPVITQTEFGTRGPFEGELAFTVAGERSALLQVLSSSPRDGGITHLASVGVTLAPGGPAQIMPAEPHPESIQIMAPQPGDTIGGGVVHVEGFGLASFEGTLVIEVYDEQGNLVSSVPTIVDAPDIGLPGTFSVDVAYSVTAEGAGRIVVVDPLPAFNGLGHIASVEVRLLP